MRVEERERQALRVLAAMPFLDRLELAAVAGMYEEASHNDLDRLRREGLADFIRQPLPSPPPPAVGDLPARACAAWA